MSNELKRQQRTFFNCIRDADERGSSAFVGDLGIKPMTGFSREDSLRVYQRGYFARIVESLAQDYPAVLRVIGGEAFENLIAEYLSRYPSTSANLMDAGDRLPSFLTEYDSPLSDIFFLPQLAMLEWAIFELGAQERQVPSGWQAGLQGLSLEQLAGAALRVSPNARELRISWNVDEIWRHARDAESTGPAEVVSEESVLLLVLGPQEIQFEKLTGPAKALWETALGARSLLELCEKVQEAELINAADFLEITRRWLRLDVARICHL